MHDALTDLHTYVLALDAERQRLGDRVTELAKLVSQEGAVLDRRRAEIAEELDALRATLVALRACADPAGERAVDATARPPVRPGRRGPRAPRPGCGSPPGA